MSSLVTKQAPDFQATAIMADDSINENFSLSEYAKGKKIVLFFYPLDFTFVCPSEIIAFSKKVESFEEKNTKLIGCSVDSHFSHYAWKNTPVNKGGIGKIKFPLVADITKNIARDYGILVNDAVALRGTFLIDEDFVIRHAVVNDLPLGRSVDETLRMVDSLNHFQENGEVCPANWKPGKEAMVATSEGVASYLESNEDDLS